MSILLFRGMFLFGIALFGFAGHALAAETATEHWRVVANETDTYHVNLSLEYIGPPLSENKLTATTTDTPAVVEQTVSAATQTINNYTTASPSENAATTSSTPEPITVTAASTADMQTVVRVQSARGDVLINEFISDPVSGEQEWIELRNMTAIVVNLSDWHIVDGSGKKTALEGTLAPLGYAIAMAPSGALNNSGDLIELYDWSDEKIDNISYGNWDDGDIANNAPAVSDPKSVGRNPASSDSFVEMNPTPGAQNVYLPPAVEINTTSVNTSVTTTNATSDASATTASNTNTNNQTTTYDIASDTSSTTPSQPQVDTAQEPPAPAEPTEPETPFTPLSRFRDVLSGTLVQTEGVVTVAPGILGKQFFYIVSGGAGVQSYLYSADFPTLERGAVVRLTGEKTEASGETRLKLSATNDIVVVGNESAPNPNDVTADQVNENYEGELVRVTGTVSSKISSGFVLTDESGEISVAIKTGTGISLLVNTGDRLTLTGIVGQTTSGYRIMPRDSADIVLRAPDAPADTTNTSETTVPAISGTIFEDQGPPSGLAGWAIAGTTILGLAGSAFTYWRRKSLTLS